MDTDLKFCENSTIDMQEFVDIWNIDEDCGIVKWCRKQGNVPLYTKFDEFYNLLKKSPEHARWIHYHLGWIFCDEVRNKLVDIVLTSCTNAYMMMLNDATVSKENMIKLHKDGFGSCLDFVKTKDVSDEELSILLSQEIKKFNEKSELVQNAIKLGIIK